MERNEFKPKYSTVGLRNETLDFMFDSCRSKNIALKEIGELYKAFVSYVYFNEEYKLPKKLNPLWNQQKKWYNRNIKPKYLLKEKNKNLVEVKQNEEGFSEKNSEESCLF